MDSKGEEHRGYFTLVKSKVGNIEALFVNSKQMDAFQWISALMTSYSRQLSRGIPLENIIQDMKETFDPNGSYFLQDGSNTEVPSVVHHLGLILEKHT